VKKVQRLLSSLKGIKPSVYLLYIAFIVPLLTILGFTITSQAKTNNNDNYNNFQFSINKSMGQDPNLAGTYNTPYLSTSMLNVNGPLQISVNWSDIYGATLETHYANLLSDTNAVAIEGNLGAMQNRINITLGHVFSTKNRIKVSAERLAQQQTFNFYSGSLDEWVSQYAGGAELQHLISTGFFNNISAGGYYARSGSKSLDPVIYTDTTNTQWINYRHIAGATSSGGHISFGLKPWKTGMLTLTSYYDSVNYNTLYSDVSAEDSSSLGYGVALEQYISHAMKATAEYSHRALYDTIQTGVQFFHNIRHNSAAVGMSLGYSHNNYNDTNSGDTDSENRYTVGLQYYFMPIKNGYTMPQFNRQSLTAWTSEPAVRMNKVMATADQEKIGAGIQWDSNLFIASEGQHTELIQWSNNAYSNVPNASITYKLNVEATDKTQDSRIINQDVTGMSQLTIQDLKPQVKYVASLVVTDNVSEPLIAEKIFTTTDDGRYDWDPSVTSSNETQSSAQLTWKAPDRTYVTDAITYDVKLTNAGNSKDVHTYTHSSSAAEGESVSIVAGTLHADTLYKVTIMPSDDHNDVYTITQTGYTCHTITNGKDTIDWDSQAVTLTNTENNDKKNKHYSLAWESAIIDKDKYPDDTVSYEYHTLATYHDPNKYDDRPNKTIDVYHGSTASTNPSNDISISKTYDDNTMTLINVKAKVIASDTEDRYNNATRTATG